jgi:hypothetical protein
VARRVEKYFFLDQWIILAGKSLSHDLLNWSALRPIVPDMKRYWADPFIIQKENRYYVFIEEKILSTNRGRIVCLTLDETGSLLSEQIVLERPYHLSYPFIFEHRGEMYMMPESAENRTVEIYRCVKFPDQWQYVKNLMTDIYAVDATLLEHENKWWLFANVKEENGSSLDSLHLFFADDPLADRWMPHPKNPIVRGIDSARPAGRIFFRDGKLIRPSQDSSRRYGFALKFNSIETLNETDYAEKNVSAFFPKDNFLATHTFNQAGDLTVVDAVIRRRK